MSDPIKEILTKMNELQASIVEKLPGPGIGFPTDVINPMDILPKPEDILPNLQNIFPQAEDNTQFENEAPQGGTGNELNPNNTTGKSVAYGE